MRGKRYTGEQIANILKEASDGTRIEEICRNHGISRTTFHRWQSRHEEENHLHSDLVKDLKEENRRLQWVVAEQMVHIQMLKGALQKNAEGG